MTTASLASERFQVEDSFEAVNDFLYEEGMTDGLPVVPPTGERIAAMLAGTTLPPTDLVGVLDPLKGEATVEKIAVNAVMAGCRPEYMPLLVAATRGLADPRFNLYGLQATTNPICPMLVINGPLRHRLQINCTAGCMGPGWRANATIGRAVRLLLLNIGGGRPGEIDKATHGQPGKFTFCFGENEEENPWEPFHVERGFGVGQSTVSLFGANGTVNIKDFYSQSAEGVLTTMAGTMTALGTSNIQNAGDEPVMVFSPEQAATVAREGLDKAAVKQWLWEHSGVPVTAFAREAQNGRMARWDWAVDGRIYPAKRPEDIIVLVAGGVAPHSVYVPTSQAIALTMPIEGDSAQA